VDQGASRNRRLRFGRGGGAPSIDDRIAEIANDEDGEQDDMAWAKPLVDEGLAALERGHFITLEEHRARNAARRASLRK
jgi:antitoxin ParD1/3/4